MTVHIDILNEAYEANDQFIQEECSGEIEDHSDEVLATLAGSSHSHDCEAGNWVTIVDGEVISQSSEFHPFRVHWERDSLADQLDEFVDTHTVEGDAYEVITQAARMIRHW